MKFLAVDAIPMFSNGVGIHLDFSETAPQVLYFDVYYTTPPVVGVQIVGSDE